MSWLSCIAMGVLGLSCIAGCGAEAETLGTEVETPGADVETPGAAQREGDLGSPSPAARGEQPPRPSPEPGEPPATPPAAALSGQASASCVALPVVSPRQPVLSYEEGCAVTSFEPMPEPMSEAGRDDARALLVGRWQLCGDAAYYGGAQHAGLEFGSNGRNQLLWSSGGSLVPLEGGPRGVYYVLGSGQFMQRGELSFSGYAGYARFDATLSVMQLASADEAGGSPLRYVRVAPDEASAAANVFSTAAGGCSMVGVWDTDPSSRNPGAAFAFNERGEWFGGEWGSDLCAAYDMYGTYNLETRGGPVMDNFDEPPQTVFELVTNVGAGQCAFWFNAGFGPTFSADCSRVHLATAWDNCTGGRGYLNSPGDDLIRRVP
jgi:hypothetical protein